jgi:hypothetical protein
VAVVSTLLAVDPGTQVSGWAVFEDEKLRDSGVILPCGESWTERGDIVVAELDRISGEHDVNNVVIEEPQQYSGGSKKARGAKGSDSILKLFALAHMIRTVLWRRGVFSTMVKPTTWKGQVPKHITRSRMERRWKRTFGELDDETDAVGLGTWWLEKRGRRKRRRRRRKR